MTTYTSPQKWALIPQNRSFNHILTFSQNAIIYSQNWSICESYLRAFIVKSTRGKGGGIWELLFHHPSSSVASKKLCICPRMGKMLKLRVRRWIWQPKKLRSSFASARVGSRAAGGGFREYRTTQSWGICRIQKHKSFWSCMFQVACSKGKIDVCSRSKFI